MISPSIHPAFRLNHKSYNDPELLLVDIKDLATRSFLTQWFDAHEAIIVRTSGSTGKPKEIPLLKQHLINSAFASASYFKVHDGTQALLCLSVDYIAGKMMWIRALTLGWVLDVITVNSHPLDGIKKKYDFVAMVPMQVQNSLAQLSQINTLIIGGGRISAQLRKELIEVNAQVFETYGMTETATHIAVKNISNKETYFQCLPNIKIAMDQRGCLVIIAPHLSDKKVISNDLVRMLSATTFEWLGRIDNVINSGGIKLIPEQIASKLASQIPGRFFLAGIPDDQLGEKMMLIIEGDRIPDLEGRINGLESLTTHEKPKAVYFIDAFIETNTHKAHRVKTLESLGLI